MERVARDLEEVKVELEELNRKWVVTDPYPRKRFRQVIIIAIVVTLIGLTWEHVTITKCFLSPVQTGWGQNACGVIYPGYKTSFEQSEKNLIQRNSDHQRLLNIENELAK